MSIESHASSRSTGHSITAIARAMAIACALALLPMLAHAQPIKHRFVATDLGTLGGELSEALAIASNGDIAGWSYNADEDPRGFFYSNGVMTELPTLGGSESQVLALNSLGLLVGSAISSDENRYATTWTNGVITQLAPPDTDGGEAYSVNAAGAIILSADSASGDDQAWIFQNGTYTPLPSLGGAQSFASDIADNG